MTMLNIYGPINDLGYGIFTKGIVSGLQQASVEFHLSVIGQPQFSSQAEVGSLNPQLMVPWNRSVPSVAIWHEFDLNKFSGKKLIAFPIFETTLFNPQAINYLSQMDAICVASSWAKDVVIANIGNSVPVYVVPGGADIIESPEILSVPKNNAFTFINVGKFEKRKNTLESIHAYILAFHNQPVDTRYIAHCFNPFDQQFRETLIKNFTNMGLTIAKQPNNNCLVASRGNAIVEVPLGRMPKESLCQLYKYSHVGVFPSRAEGWNLPLMEAMQLGLPCIATNYSAHTQYCTEEFGFPSELLLKKTTPVVANDGIFFKGDRGDWIEIDVAELAQKMIDVYNNYAAIMASFNPSKLRETFNWKNSSAELLKVIDAVK